MIIRGLHSSPHLFDFPDFAASKEARKTNGRHDNGGMGLWMTLDLDHWSVSNFGTHLYEVEMEIGRLHIDYIHLDTLSNLGRYDPDFTFSKHREILVNEGIYLTKIIEGQGVVVQGILHELSCIKSFNKIN